jgi:Fic family protein
MLEAVAETAKTTLQLVSGIGELMQDAKHRMREELPKLYSQELLNNLFRHPYTRIEYVQGDLKITRQTAARYLDNLAEHGFLDKHRAGKNNYFINTRLVRLLMTVSEAG